MTDKSLVERRYLLLKRGLYYRPDDAGYTGIKEQAGRYLETDASPESGVTAIHEDEAPDFAPSCWDDVARNHLQSKIEAQQAEIERLRDALASIGQDATNANDFLGEDTDIEAVLNTIIFQAGAALNEGTGR